MFELDELAEVFTTWRNRGVLSSANRTRLKKFYFYLEGIPEQGCTTCPGFWLQVQAKIFGYLRKNGIDMKASNRKWKFKKNTGSYQPFASQVTYVLEGEQTKSVKVLSDEEIDELVKADPALLKSTFERNLAYVEPTDVAELAVKTSEEDTADEDAKKAKTSTAKSDSAKTVTAKQSGDKPAKAPTGRAAAKIKAEAAKADAEKAKADAEKPPVQEQTPPASETENGNKNESNPE